MDKARLPNPRFPNNRYHLTAAVTRTPQRALELLQLDFAADEARQAASCRNVQAVPRGSGAFTSWTCTGTGSPFTGTRPRGFIAT